VLRLYESGKQTEVLPNPNLRLMDQVREVLRITAVFIAPSKMIVNEFFFRFKTLAAKCRNVEMERTT